MATSAADFLPSRLNLMALRRASKVCEGCELYKNATQTVFGAGPASAVAVFVGEQPGDVEDIQGEPFVGPAGKLFDKLLAEAGIDRQAVYVTNAVKHFKWKPRGKRRMLLEMKARVEGTRALTMKLTHHAEWARSLRGKDDKQVEASDKRRAPALARRR